MNHASILKELPERFLSELTNYCVTDPSIEKIVLFGSRARGDFNKRSDIDIALYTTNITSSEQNMIEDKILKKLRRRIIHCCSYLVKQLRKK